MNNKHQELIAQKVAEVCNKIKLDYLLKADSLLRGMCLDKELRIVLTKTLQDTIDTVLAGEKRRVLPYIERIRLDVDVIICKCGEKYKDSDLDLSVQELEEALTPNK